MTVPESELVAAIDPERLVQDVRELVRIESWDGAESEAQRLMASLMEEAGLEVDLWDIDLPTVQSHPDASWELERDEALGLVGTLRGRGGGRSLILNGHVDVVPPGDPESWTSPPFAPDRRGGRLYGRGTLDMKGPLIAGLHALKAVKSSGVELAGDVHLQSVIGEEDGGLGTLATILRGYAADGAIVMEPTSFAVAPVQAGCLNFRVRVTGLAAHGAVREEGVNAFELLFTLYAAIRELEAARNERHGGEPGFERYRIPFPISIGLLSGGDWASSVPDQAQMEGRMGIAPDEDFAAARAELENAVAEAAQADSWLRDHPPVVEWYGGRFLPARVPAGHPLPDVVADALGGITGEVVRVEGVTFGADAGLLDRVGGVPTVLFGAGDIRQAHRSDESVAIAHLVTMAATLAVAIQRFCG